MAVPHYVEHDTADPHGQTGGTDGGADGCLAADILPETVNGFLAEGRHEDGSDNPGQDVDAAEAGPHGHGGKTAGHRPDTGRADALVPLPLSDHFFAPDLVKEHQGRGLVELLAGNGDLGAFLLEVTGLPVRDILGTKDRGRRKEQQHQGQQSGLHTLKKLKWTFP